MAGEREPRRAGAPGRPIGARFPRGARPIGGAAGRRTAARPIAEGRQPAPSPRGRAEARARDQPPRPRGRAGTAGRGTAGGRAGGRAGAPRPSRAPRPPLRVCRGRRPRDGSSVRALGAEPGEKSRPREEAGHPLLAISSTSGPPRAEGLRTASPRKAPLGTGWTGTFIHSFCRRNALLFFCEEPGGR